MLNITKPLRRILKIRNNKGNVVVIEAKYERVPVFCYVCGVLGIWRGIVRRQQRMVGVRISNGGRV